MTLGFIFLGIVASFLIGIGAGKYLKRIGRTLALYRVVVYPVQSDYAQMEIVRNNLE